MKSQSFVFAMIGLLVFPVFAANAEEQKGKQDEVGYSLGYDIGKNFKKQEIKVDPDAVKQGIVDALGEDDPKLTPERMQEVLKGFRQGLMAKQQLKLRSMGDENRKEGEAFLAANKEKEGIITLPSGLQYRVIQEGKGEKPSAQDIVKVNYKGTLINGSEFDSSDRRGRPGEFPVQGVIKGWTEALQMMPEGSKWELYVPSELAYGARGAGQVIGPNTTLIYELELLSIEARLGDQKNREQEKEVRN